MSETVTPVKTDSTRPTRRAAVLPTARRAPVKRSGPNLDEFKAWLAEIKEVNATIHVNGAAHTNCVLSVDFGQPLVQFRLTNEQQSDLVARMRKAARDIVGRVDASVRVSNDNSAGIWWATVG